MEQVNNSTEQAGATARAVCIHIAKEMSELVKHTLGPMGLDNMLVDGMKDSVITNDGATIVKESAIDHPVAKVIMEVARTQEENCYDGTTSSIILTGELMDQASSLLKKKIHPSKIAMGYQLAAVKAEEVLLDMGLEVDDEVLQLVAETAMTGKSAESDKEHLAAICVDVAQATDLSNINIVSRAGGRISDSVAIAGILVDREKCHHDMPDTVEDAKIALVNVDISLPEFAKAINVQVQDNQAIQEFIESRKQQLADIATGIIETGTTAVFCMRDIDPFVQEYFAKHGIYAARRVAKSDLESLSMSTGARIISNLDNLTKKDLGSVELLEEVSVNDKPLIKVTGTKSSKSVSVLLRAPTQHVVDEVARAFDDAVGVVSVALEDNRVLPGGGAPYMALANALRAYALSVGGRQQLAIESFAKALEVIPTTLAQNSGNDSIDTMVALRHAHNEEDGWKYGVNVNTGGSSDMLEERVVEPKRVVAQAIRSSADTASQLIRIEKILSAKKSAEFGDDGFDY